METVTDFIFLASKITADGVCSHEIQRPLAYWKKSYDQPRQHIKKQRHYFTNKSPSSQSYGFSSSHVSINSEYSWEVLTLKLKFQYFGHLMCIADSLEKTLMLGKIKGKRTKKWQRTRWLDGITDPMKVKEESEKAGLKLNIQKNLRSWHQILSLNGK